MDRSSLKDLETRRIKLTELILWWMRPKLFLGRGPQAKWFVLHQALDWRIFHRESECSSDCDGKMH